MIHTGERADRESTDFCASEIRALAVARPRRESFNAAQPGATVWTLSRISESLGDGHAAQSCFSGF